MTSETAGLYILDNLSSVNKFFFPRKKEINKTCPTPKNVWVATENVNNLTSESKFFLTQDIIINMKLCSSPMGIIITYLESTNEIDVCTLQARNNN